MKTKSLKKSVSYIFCLILFHPLISMADSGAMYDAWENGEEIVTPDTTSSMAFGDFFYSPDGDMEAPPPVKKKAKWERFKSLEEHGAVGAYQYESSTQDEYRHSNTDPFANRINDIENLLSR